MISDFFTTAFTVRRASWQEDGEGNEYSEEAEVGSFSGHLQQASPLLAQSLGLTFTKTFTIWCPVSTNVLEGDTVEGGENAYSVRAIQRNAVGSNQHLELIVELDETVNGS